MPQLLLDRNCNQIEKLNKVQERLIYKALSKVKITNTSPIQFNIGKKERAR